MVSLDVMLAPDGHAHVIDLSDTSSKSRAALSRTPCRTGLTRVRPLQENGFSVRESGIVRTRVRKRTWTIRTLRRAASL